MGALKEDSWKSLIGLVCTRLNSLTGNVFGERQLPMVEARLRRHLQELGVSVEEYPTYWKANAEKENSALIALLTTHFTSFFREFLHFEWIAENLPGLVASLRDEGKREIKFWSAACSRGQEVWSLAMWLHYHMPIIAPDFKWSVHGTDIDMDSVKIGMNAVYHRRELETAPRYLWEKVWQKGSGDISDWYKMKKEIREKCSFGHDNLLSLKTPGIYDVILCRNVLIYFDQNNQLKAVTDLIKRLSPKGVLITGVSESLAGLNLKLKSHAPSVYTRSGAIDHVKKAIILASGKSSIPKPLKVLCVDDSGTVQTILKKLLNSEGFEVIGTAMNGQEALDKIKSLKPDVITLDLHMPVMDGFTLVKQTSIAQDFPIVVVSTVERQNAQLVHPLFDAGVCDFLEKPTMDNMSKVGDELKQKLKMAWFAKQRGQELRSQPVEAIKTIRGPARIVLNGGVADRDVITAFLKSSNWDNDEVCVHLKGEAHLWEDWANKLKSQNSDTLIKATIKPEWVRDSRSTIVFNFCAGDISVIDYSISQGAQIIFEEGDWSSSDSQKAQDFFPATSFAYMANKLLEGK